MPLSTSFARRRPAEAERVSGLVVLALDHVWLAAVIEAEDLVVEVESGDDQLEPVAKLPATLRVDLGVVVEVDVPERPLDAAGVPSAYW